MRDFVYHRPTSLEDAGRLAASQGAMLLAGGQTLLRDMKLGKRAPASLVDVSGLLPGQIELRDGTVTIGAGATHAEVAAAPVLRRHLPVLADLVGHIGDPAVRNRGTLGGSLAGNEPAGEYPAACLALDAEVQTTGRTIAAVEFFQGDRRTVLEPGEIVLSATFPLPRQAAYLKFLNPAARYPMVGVFVAVAGPGTPRVAVTGARVSGTFRWREAESALDPAFTPEELRGVRLSLQGLVEDLFADAAYRAHLAGVLAHRAVALAGGQVQTVVVLSHGSPAGSGTGRV
jgi:carbon-monoxide dehydrogenase medium subunit